jgi:hypothetical protein
MTDYPNLTEAAKEHLRQAGAEASTPELRRKLSSARTLIEKWKVAYLERNAELIKSLQECEELRRLLEEARADVLRLKREKKEYLNIKTTDGLTASEWVMRTASAEAKLDDARAHYDALREALSDVTLLQFAQTNGARELHRSWRDTMLAQGREVYPPERLEWNTLPVEDKALDAQCSFDVLRDFATWALSQAALTPQEAECPDCQGSGYVPDGRGAGEFCGCE